MRYRFLRFPKGRYKAVTFSYDDGCREDIRMAETLSRHGIKSTFNISSDFMGKIHAVCGSQYLTREEIVEHLLSKGHEIAVHGASHRAPGKQRSIDGIQDVLRCRLELEKSFDRIIRGMAYPDSGVLVFQNGASYGNVRQYLQDLDIAYARTLGENKNSFALPTDWYAWVPTVHHRNPQVFDYIKEFLELDTKDAYASVRMPQLFYLWGHSYEFEVNNEWTLLEDICEKLGGNDEIWYATNMEIYDYVIAYNSLVFSADSTRVYNPTLLEVWFDVDATLYSIKPGETLRLDISCSD